MAAGVIIGRVAVKVIPDTDRFKEELEKQLNSLERTLDPVQIDINVDTSGVVRAARKARDDAQKAMKDLELDVRLDDEGSVRNAISRLRQELVKLGEVTTIPVDLNKDSLEAAIEMLEEQLEGIRTIELQVDEANPASVRRALATVEREIEKLREVKVEVSLDEPSLAEYRRKLLENINKSYGEVRAVVDKALNDIDVDLNLDPQTVRNVKAQIDKLVSDIEAKKLLLQPEMDEAERAKIEASIEEMTRKAIVLRTEIDANSIRESVDLVNLQFSELRKRVETQLSEIKISPIVDTKLAQQSIRQLDEMLEEIERQKLVLEMDLDDESRRDVERKIADLQERVADIRVNIEPNVPSSLAALVAAKLALLARDRTVEYLPRVNKAAASAVGMALARMSGARIVSGYMQDLYNSIIQFDKAVPKIIALSVVIAGLGSVGIASASNLFALSASLASIAPAALAIPGILGGMAVGIGVMIAALKDFNTVFPGFQDSLSKMQDSISANFWDGAKASMSEMIDVLIPALTRGFDQVATRLGNFSSKFTSAVTQQLAPALSPMFDNLAKSIDIAAGAADNIVGIITTLGTVGSSYLPALAGWFAKVTTQFDNFLKRSEQSGEIYDWIDTGIQALKDLGSVAKNAALILHDIAAAATAAGGTSLSSLADTLGRIRDITSSAGFQTGLTEVFQAAHTAMAIITDRAGPALFSFFGRLGETISTILPIAGEAIGTLLGAVASALDNPVLVEGIVDMFQGIRSGIELLVPAFVPLVEAIATMGPLVGALATTLGGVLGAAIPPVAQALMAMGEALEPLVPILGTALVDAVNAITPSLPILADAFSGLITDGAIPAIITAIEALIPIITTLAPMIADTLANALIAITPYIPILAAGFAAIVTAAADMIPPLLQFVNEVLVPLGVAIAEIVADALPKFAEAFGKVASAVGPLIDALTDLWNFVSPVLIPVLKFLAEVIVNTVVTAIKGVTNIIKGGLNVIQGIFKAFKSLFTGDWRGLWDGVKKIGQGIWQLIVGAIQLALTVPLLRIGATFITAMRSLWANGWQGIRTLLSGVWGSITSAAGSFMSAVRGAISTGLSAIRSAFSTAWSTISSATSAAWSGFRSVISTGMTVIRSVISAGWTAVRSLTTQAFAALRSAVSTGISNALALIRAFPGRIRDAMGNVGSILRSAGLAVIQGFIDGIQSAFGRVRSTLSSLTSMLPDWKGPRDRDKTILTEAGKLVMGGFLEGLESQYDSIRKSLKGLTDDLSDTFIEAPQMAEIQAPKAQTRKGLVGGVRTAVAESQSVAAGRTLIYHAAPGSSLGSEEDLFAAADRGRMVGW